MERIKFNLSPTGMGLYEESQLRFYYSKIAKLEPTDETVQCYGIGGSIVHKCVEDSTGTESMKSLFYSYWIYTKMSDLISLNGKPLDVNQYYESYLRAEAVKLSYPDGHEEELMLFPLIDNETHLINAKGFIDFQTKNHDLVIDWKTKNKVDHEGCYLQAKHYAWSVYKKYSIIPKVQFYYTKLDVFDDYEFVEEDMVEHEKYLYNMANEIAAKGDDINNFKLGKIESIFNEYKTICREEKDRRSKK